MKLLKILAITAVAFNINTTHAATCNNGFLITGANEHEYCVSDIEEMNWWSAYTWCEAQGRHLATIYEACPDWDGSIGQGKCTNSTSTTAGYNYWVSTANGSTLAFRTHGFSSVYSSSRDSRYHALCY